MEVQRVLGPERRISRLEKEDQLVQKAMRKKSRKVRTLSSATTDVSFTRCLGREISWCS